MKLGLGLLNVLTVADSWENARNPVWVGMLHPAYGVQLAGIWESSVLSENYPFCHFIAKPH